MCLIAYVPLGGCVTPQIMKPPFIQIFCVLNTGMIQSSLFHLQWPHVKIFRTILKFFEVNNFKS